MIQLILQCTHCTVFEGKVMIGAKKWAETDTVVAESMVKRVIRAYDIRTFYDRGFSAGERYHA